MPIDYFTTYTGDGAGGAPFGNPQANPQGSNYAGIAATALSAQETILLEKEVMNKIIMTAPEQFNALKLTLMNTPKTVGSDEWEWLEMDDARAPFVVDGAVSAVSASAGTSVTATVTAASQASIDAIGIDSRLQVSATQQAVVSAISGLDITIKSMTGEGIPAIADGAELPVLGPIGADQQDDWSQYFRSKQITRYNFLQIFFRACKWGRMELAKYENQGRTDFLQKDYAERIRQLRQDIFAAMWNGVRGEQPLADGTYAKTTQGIYPAMVADGAIQLNPTLSYLPQAFEQGGFASNRAAEGATKYVYGTDESLFHLSKAYKENLVRYTPNDMVANMNLKAIEMGTMRFVMVPTELWKKRDLFREEWSRRLIILDPKMVTPVNMRQIPMFSTDLVAPHRYADSAAREGSMVKWAEAVLGWEVVKPSHGYIINIQSN